MIICAPRRVFAENTYHYHHHLSVSRSAKCRVLIWERALLELPNFEIVLPNNDVTLSPPPPTQPPLLPFWPLFNNNPCQHFLAKITQTHLPVPSCLHHSGRQPGPSRSTYTFLNGNLGYSGQQRPMPNIHKVCLE